MGESEAGDASRESVEDDVPIMQKIFDSIWFLAGVAIIFFMLSYIVWGFIDLLTIPMG